MTVIEQQILCSLQGNESNKSRTRQAHPIDPQAIITIKNQVPGNLNCVDCDAPSKCCRERCGISFVMLYFTMWGFVYTVYINKISNRIIV